MRYDAEHKEQTRAQVLKAAARSIRARGPHKVSVAAVMAEVGLTHGGFYAHFPSKDALVAAAIERMFVESRRRLPLAPDRGARLSLTAYVDFYLSPAHRDARGSGCPLPFLAADAPRLPAEARQAFAGGVARMTASLTDLMRGLGRAAPDADAASMLAELVGALSLARAEPDPVRSDAMLAHSRAALKSRFALEPTE